MPTYSYKCNKCETDFDKFLSISDYDKTQKCPECNSTRTAKVMTVTGIIFKGDDWASKNNRISGQMAKKHARLSQKVEEKRRDAPGMTLAPNVDGEVVSSWNEAKSLAASKGKDTKSYEKQVQKEKKLKGKIEVVSR